MRGRISFVLIILLLASFGPSSLGALSWAGQIQVFFSPDGGCTQAIVKQIDNAKRNIFLQAYAFTSKPIMRALIKATKRNVKVIAILDKSNRFAKYSTAAMLKNGEILVLIDDKHAIAHNKIMIIDERVVITGSFNFTMAAEKKNAENLLILEDMPQITPAYLNNFKSHLEHSVP